MTPPAESVAVVRALRVERDDAAVVQGLKAGETWAQSTLFERHGRDAERVLTRILGRDPELQDLLQEVFLRAIEGVHRLHDPEKLRSWVVAIAVFTARERIRARRRRSWLVLFSRHEVEQAPQGDADDPDRDMADATYRVLERLKEDERIALALRGIDGMQVSEVAEACGVSRSTIKRVLARAQARFRLLARSEPALREWVQQLGERA